MLHFLRHWDLNPGLQDRWIHWTVNPTTQAHLLNSNQSISCSSRSSFHLLVIDTPNVFATNYQTQWYFPLWSKWVFSGEGYVTHVMKDWPLFMPRRGTVWPVVKIKSSQVFHKTSAKSSQSSLTFRGEVTFLNSPKSCQIFELLLFKNL